MIVVCVSKLAGSILTESVVLTVILEWFRLDLGVIILALLNKALQNEGGVNSMFTNPKVDFNVVMIVLRILISADFFAGIIPVILIG